MNKEAAVIFLVLVVCQNVISYNILVVAPFFGKSHSAFIHPIVLGLAEKGHDVTIITTNLIKDPPRNVKQVQPNVHGKPINSKCYFL
jgi:glucuronosyltransferase